MGERDRRGKPGLLDREKESKRGKGKETRRKNREARRERMEKRK